MPIQNSPTAVRRRRAKSKVSTSSPEELAFERIVFLPMDLAVVYSAAQNFRLDVAKGCHTDIKHAWKQYWESYYYEAKETLLAVYCNHFPGNNPEPWIHLRQYGLVAYDSVRAEELLEIFRLIFERNDSELFSSQLYPDPRTSNDGIKIHRLNEKVKQRLKYH
jgi:hypothetical protein